MTQTPPPVLPEGVTTIDTYAFSECENLASITIPSTVTYIGDSAFSNCDKLAEIVFTGTEEQWNAITVGNYNESLNNAVLRFDNGEDEPSDFTGLEPDEIGTWYYYVNGVLQSEFTGLVYFNDTFFYVQNGILDTSYVGLVEFYGTWYYVEGGIINFNYSGPAVGPDGITYSVVNGVVV